MNLYQMLARPLLFRLDPETSHRFSIRAAQWIGASPRICDRLTRSLRVTDSRLQMRVAELEFPNPIGLAAGFDKNARAITGLFAVGFGFIEVGSVSLHASQGNPRPRLFRLPQDGAIVVNYGVPNDGAKRVTARLTGLKRPVPLGMNLVETNRGRIGHVDVDQVIREFADAAAQFSELCDYIALNLNCPNTGGGKSPFDDPAGLRALLDALSSLPSLPPVFLKVSAALPSGGAETIASVSAPYPFVKGFILNAPSGKCVPLATPKEITDCMPGTVCGRPLRLLIDQQTTLWFSLIDRKRHALVCPGGLETAADVYRRLRLGASLVQVYTALIYQGPTLVRDLNRGLLELMNRDGVNHLSEIIGIDAC